MTTTFVLGRFDTSLSLPELLDSGLYTLWDDHFSGKPSLDFWPIRK